MRPLPALLGSLLTVGTLTGANLEGDPVTGPAQSDTPVLYDVADPSGLYESIKGNPELQLAYGEQVLKALAASVQDSARSQTRSSSFLRELPVSTPGTFSVNVSSDAQGNLVINGHTKMEPGSPYVYADNIIWTTPACSTEGRSHLTHGFRKQNLKSEVSQSVWTGESPMNTRSSIGYRGQESITVAGEAHQDRLAQYNEIARQVACQIQAALK